MRKRLLYLIILVVSVLSLAGCQLSQSSADNTIHANGKVNKYEVSVQTSTSSPVYGSVVEMLDAIRPSVVEVYAQNEFAQGTAAGSGVIFSRTGTDTSVFTDDYFFVITCHHVIEGRDKYLIKDLDGNNYSASLIGGDPKMDIAVLRMNPAKDGYTEDKVNLSVAIRRDIETAAPLKVGEDVYAIGNAIGALGGTVTEGIVSAVDRVIPVQSIGEMNLIQTDCAINGGNSGGGLFDSQGNLIGITNSGYDNYQGLNFAIPIDDAFDIYKSLMETYFYVSDTQYNYGYVEGRAKACAEHGVSLAFGSEIAFYDYSSNFKGYPACVMAVKEGSVYSDFAIGDLVQSVTYKEEVYKVNLNSYYPAQELAQYLNSLELKVGDKVTFTVSRAGTLKTIEVTYKQFIYGDTGYTLVA
ncbi:MAG: trypsin-like peptidase domain-containing protein [Clostridia bacterium]|nr:trypsin-like peptidase domain-containing protein [Clostridia bacterium]